VKHWLTPRLIVIALLMFGAPAAALGHWLLTWLPGAAAVAQARAGAARRARELNARIVELENARLERAQIERIASGFAETGRSTTWLEQRDKHGVFERLASALVDERVAIERLTLGEPGVYAAAAGANLLACEQVSIECVGDYAALTECLERLEQLELPKRFRRVAWRRENGRLRLEIEIEIPFVPRPALRSSLARSAGLKPDDEH
jgi:hypothetical protein